MRTSRRVQCTLERYNSRRGSASARNREGRSPSFLVSRVPGLHDAPDRGGSPRSSGPARSWTAAAAPVRTWSWLDRFGRAFGFDLSSVGLRSGREAGRPRLARATVTAAPFPDRRRSISSTSFDVLYSLEEPDERAAVAEMFRLTRPGGFALINVAAMDVLRGDHSVLSERCGGTAARICSAWSAGAGFTIVRLTYTNVALFLPLRRTADGAAVARARSREHRARSRSRPRRSTRCSRHCCCSKAAGSSTSTARSAAR